MKAPTVKQAPRRWPLSKLCKEDKILAPLKVAYQQDPHLRKNSLLLPTQVIDERTGKITEATALVDSGATESFIDKTFVYENDLPTIKLSHPIPVRNVDGTPNEGGRIVEKVPLTLKVEDHREHLEPYVTSLKDTPILLGHPWLKQHNPSINWRTNRVDFISTIRHRYPKRILATSTHSNRLAEAEHKVVDKTIPDRLKDFGDVFSQGSFDELPPNRAWDHTIDLIPDAQMKRSKVYPLSPKEMNALKEFIDENLRTGRIRPSKSPMTSPVFFVGKKDGSLRCVQDY